MGTAAFDLSTLKPVNAPPAPGPAAFDLSTLKPAAIPAPAAQAAPAPGAPPRPPSKPLLDFSQAHMPGDRGDLSDIPAPMPKTAPATGADLNAQELADQPPAPKVAPIFGEMEAQQQQLNRAVPAMGPAAPLPPPIPIRRPAPKPLSAAEQEFNRQPGVGDRSEFVVRDKPQPVTFAEQQIQQQGAAEPIPMSPQLVPAAPVRLAEPPGPERLNLKKLPEQIGAQLIGEFKAGTPAGEAEREAYASPLNWQEQEAQGEQEKQLRQQRIEQFENNVLPRLIPTAEQKNNQLEAKDADEYQRIKAAVTAGHPPASIREMNLYLRGSADEQAKASHAQYPNSSAVADAIQDKLSDFTRADQLAILAMLPESKLVSLYFGGTMAAGVKNELGQVRQDVSAGDTKKAVYHTVGAIIDGIAATLALRHGIPEAKSLPAPVRNAVDSWAQKTLEETGRAPSKTAVKQYIEDRMKEQQKDQAAPGGEPKFVEPTAEEKPVLHDENASVEELRASAERHAEPLGDALSKATEGVEGAKLEAVRDAKDTDRIEDKAERQGVQPAQIGDISAAKVVVPDQAAADQVLQNLHGTMPVEAVNGSVSGEPGKNGVRQVQATVDLGKPEEPVKKAEVLIQTPEMAEATAKTHDDYRKAQELRQAGDEAGAKAIEEQIQKEHEAAEQAARQRQQAAEPEKQGRPVLSDSSEQTQLGNKPPTQDKVERVPVSQISLDPKRFQYKMDTDTQGVTNLLKGRKWNEDLAGRINVWRDPADNKLYVVNGHHRFQLASENGVPDVKVDYINAGTPEEARAIGALQNIAEGRGSAMDAAKFFRDSGYTPDRLDDLGISMGEATAANGVALSRLDPSIFDQVVNGKLRQGRAIAIGKASADAADQEALLKLIQKAESKGKKVTDDVVDELARMVKGSAQHTETQQNLFGAQEMTRNLALEKADISSSIREKIGQERRTFQSVADAGKAATLAKKVEGQTIKASENAKIAEEAQQAQELYDRLSTRAGTIDDILNRSAKELAAGGNANGIKQRAYDDIRAELSKALAGATGGDDRGVQAPSQKARPAGSAPVPRTRGAEPAAAERGTDGSAGPTDLKPPAPKEQVFTEGRQSTPVMVRDADGNWVHGTLDYHNGGVNGQPRRGRVTLANGFKMNNVADADMRPATDDQVAEKKGEGQHWVGVDIDGTLAEYDGYKGKTVIGKPIKAMVDRVKAMLAAGKDIRIFTARIGDDPTGEARAAIDKWVEEHIGQKLPITNVKDSHMEQLYDDRAVGVGRNTGEIIGGEDAQNPVDREGKAPAPRAVATGAEQDQAQPRQSGGGTEPVVKREKLAAPPAPQSGSGEGRGDEAGRVSGRPAGDDAVRSVPAKASDAGDQLGRSETPVSTPREPGRREDATSEQRENQTRAEDRKAKLKAAADRSLRENAASHKSTVEEINGRKAVVLDPDGEGVWHRVFKKLKDVGGRNPLGAGENWRGVRLDRTGVNIATAYLKGAIEDLRAMGTPDDKAEAGFERLTQMLKEARDQKGGAVILRGDYRADTAREEATHQWWAENDLDRSDAMLDTAARPEFQETAEKLRKMGYEDASPKTVAAEIMAKAMAGDPDLDLTDEERENIVRSFLTAAVEEKGPRVLDELPEADPRLKDVIDEVRRTYGEQSEPGAEGSAGQAIREQGEPSSDESRAGPGGPRDSDQERSRQSSSERVQSGDEEKPVTKAELEAAGQSSFFQRKAPRPVESLALPGMDRDIEANKESAAEEQGKALTDRLREPGKNVDAAAGRMEQHSPLFSGTDANPQFSLFQKSPEDRSPVIPFPDRGAKSESELDESIKKSQEEHGQQKPGFTPANRAAETALDERLAATPPAEGQGPGGTLPFVERQKFAEASAKRDRELDDLFANAVGRKPDAAPRPNLKPLKSIAQSMEEWKRGAGKLANFETMEDWSKARTEKLKAVLNERKESEFWNAKQQAVYDRAVRDQDEELKATRAADRAARAERMAGNPVARSVKDLVDEMRNAPKPAKGTMLDRVANWTKDTIDESVGRSGAAIEKIPDGFQKAWAWSKATTAALVHDYLHPLEQTDWKKSAGQMQLAQAETSLRLHDLAKELKTAAPKPLDRIAMTHYMEAGGDQNKLRQWAMGAKTNAIKSLNNPLLSRETKNYLRDAVDHYEAAQKLTPEQKQLATQLRQHFDDMLEIAKENGLLEYGYRNYVMHLYEKAEAANLLNMVDTMDLQPNPNFIKKRFFDTFYSAEQAGMKPKSKDIGYLLTAYDKSMNQAIASRNFMRSLLDAKAPDGRPIAAIKMRGGWVIAKEGEAPQVLRQRARPASLEGYRDFDRPQLRNFLFKPTTEDLAGFDPKLFDEDPDKLAFKGDLIIHPRYASQVEDLLTPSWFERGNSWPQKLGKGLQTISGIAKESMTAAAPFHMVQLGVHGTEHLVNPFKVPDIDLSGKSAESQVQRLLASHGLALVNYDAEGLFGTKAFAGIAEHIPFVNKAMDTVQAFSHWQFQDYIPRLKMKMAVDAFKRNTEKYGNKLSEDQIAELTAKESNAAFGNLNTMFDSVPRTKTFKSLLKLATFAPDFLESRIRFVGQALTPYGGEQRAALARGALAMYIAARVGNALINNGDAKWDPAHAFSLVINGKEYAMRTVQGDLLHAVDDPRGFIYNRLNPLTTRPMVEFLSGRDQMGRQLTAGQQVKDLAKAVLPFGIQKVIQTPDESLLNSILTSAGVNARNDRTPIEDKVHRMYLANLPSSPVDEEKLAESRQLRQHEDAMREGREGPNEVWKLVDKGEISPAQAARTIKRSNESRLSIEFKALHLDQAAEVYEDLIKEAKHPKIYPHVAMALNEITPEMQYKRTHDLASLPEADRDKWADKLDALLNQAPLQ